MEVRTGIFTFIFLFTFVGLKGQNGLHFYALDVIVGDTLTFLTIEKESGDESQLQSGNEGSFIYPYAGVEGLSNNEIPFSIKGYRLLRVLPDLKDGQPGQVFTLYLEPKTYQLKEVLLPASLKNNLSSPSISYLDKEDLRRDNQLSMAPVLNRVPGVYMHMGTLNTSRLTIRGIGSRSLFSTTKVKAYLDNIPLTTGDGETTIEDLDLPFIDNVRVIRGPGSSLFGAGLGGVLLMESDAGGFRENSLRALFQQGSFGLQRASLGVNTGGENSSLGLHMGYLHSDGWRENNRYDRFQASLQGRLVIDEHSYLSILATFLDVKGFIPSSLDSSDFASSPEKAAFTWNQTQGNEDYIKGLLGITYARELNPNWTLKTSFPLSFRGNDELRPFNFLRESSLTLGNRSVLEGGFELLGREVELFVGEEIFQEFYSWQTYENVEGKGDIAGQLSDNREQRRYINGFFQAGWKFQPSWQLLAGANVNKTWYHYEDFFFEDGIDLSGEYAFRAQVSPRLVLQYRPLSDHVLSAQLSQGFSPPLLAETLTPEGQINPDIRPESGWNIELGAKGQFSSASATSWTFSYGITTYLLWAQDLIVPRRVGNDQLVGINAGRTRHAGLESEFEGRISLGRRSDLQLWGQYTFMDQRFVEFSDEEEGEVYDGNAIPGLPPHQASLGAEWVYSPRKMKSQWEVAINGQWTQWIKGQSLSLGAGIQNIFDASYASMILVNAGSFGGNDPRYYYPAMPRNYYVDLRLSLSHKK